MSILDIARSGVMAYRSALSQTAENVANANTEGYVRRDVMLKATEIGVMTPESATSVGGGVTVVDVRRAFDGLTADRMRASESALSAADAQVAAGDALEQAFLPGAEGIDAAMDDFFSGLTSLAAQPADLGLRKVVMQTGETVAARFAEAGTSLENLKQDALATVSLAAEKASSLLSGLFSLNRQMIAAQSALGAANALYDQRDAALTELAKQVQINVSLDDKGAAEVRLGPGPGGMVLLDAKSVAEVSLGGSTPLSLAVTRNGVTTKSTVLTGGEIGGQVGALTGINAAIEELDQLAQRFTENLNAAHAAGIDLDAEPGKALFDLGGVSVTPRLGNSGGTVLLVDGKGLSQNISLRYNGQTSSWQAIDAAGSVLATGSQSLTIDGVAITLEGTARDGDTFDLTPRSGKAVDMTFALTDPRKFAAAGATVVGPAPGNTGSGTATILPVTLPATGLSPISPLLSADPANATALLQAGVVGVIPAGTGAVDLISYGRQSGLDFAITDAGIAAGGTLGFTANGTTQVFTFPAGLDSASLALALNQGDLVSDTGASFADLGIRAAGVSGQLSLALGSGDFTSGQIQAGGATTSGIPLPADSAASSIQIFTRDGRQIAGTPLSASEIAALFTAENGFLAGAEYRSDYLNGTDGIGYRDTEIQRQLASGAQALTLTPGGADSGTLTLTNALGATTLTVPEGASAARLAALVEGALPGLTADAETTLTLSAISDGTVSFNLAGANVSPVTVSAKVAGGDLSALTRAINNLSGATGIGAELSADGSRIMLRQPGGEDIRLTDFAHDLAGGMVVTPTNADGVARAAQTTLGLATQTTTVRVAGQVQLSSATSFSANLDGVISGSVADPFVSGLVQKTTSAAGDAVTLHFEADPMTDGAATSADGLNAVAAGLSHQLDVNGVTIGISGAATPEAIAAGLLADLRAASPAAMVTGTALAQLPPEGSTVSFKLDGQNYALRMQGGTLVVDGPEAGRVTASFDGLGRLTLSANGGSPDGLGFVIDNTTAAAQQFGLGAGASQSLTGQPIDPAQLSADGSVFSVTVGQQSYQLGVSNQGGALVLDVPADFPGEVTLSADNRISVATAFGDGPLKVAVGNDLAGFAVAGVFATTVNDGLSLISANGLPPTVSAKVTATAAERLHLSSLPPEDLIVVMSGQGALRLGGSTTNPATPPTVRPTELRMVDAASGKVELFDQQSGSSIATGYLDAQGRATLGGYQVRVTGNVASGDGFILSPNTTPGGDSRVLQNLVALADADPSSGQGGFARILAELTVDIGSQLKASQQKQQVVAAGHENLARKLDEIGGVDLDAEAARLVELQQAYQANAQTMAIARELFDTLLQIM